MKLYLAGIYTSNFEKDGRTYQKLLPAEKAARDMVEHHLESYHYIHKQSFVDKIRRDKIKVFLDSGAFSAFTKGVEIDMRGYCNYIQKNADIIQYASVLDGIGDPLKTWQNQQAMESMGVRPLPCFHYNEDERYLEWYMQRYEYITLGGMVPISNPQLVYWLDRLWSKYLCDGAGNPKIKVHGFGLTSPELMLRYPWYSVDSSAWVQKSAFGTLMIPEIGKIVPVSTSSTTFKKQDAHLETLPDVMREQITKYITGVGFDPERLRVEYASRWAFNCYAYTRLGQMSAKIGGQFKANQQELF